MFDWLRELMKSAEVRQQERISAYVDNQLSEAERQQIEAEMRDDATLRAEIESLQRLKAGLRAMPRATAPRNFILDPAEFANKPAPAYEARAYPVLRGATAMAGLMFMLLLVFGVLTNQGGLTSAPVAMESLALEEPAADAVAVEEPAAMVEESAEMMVEEVAPAVEAELAVPTVSPSPLATDPPAVAEEAAMEEMVVEEDVAVEAEPAADEAADRMILPTEEPAARASDAMIIIPPTDTPELSKSVEQSAEPTLAPPTFAAELLPTLAPEIQAQQEIAEHDVIETEVGPPLDESRVSYASPQPASLLLQRIAIAFGILFALMLVVTLIIRQRLNRFD